ncbi:MAG: chemotaxis protein CheA [Eubacteriales bacterium]|nr:chemotaxis protein CheA [Eubacteriales bacterium]
MSDADNINDSVLDMYLFESSTLLEQLDGILIESEKDGELSSQSVDEIFRIMHTIKGSSAMMDYEVIAQVCHKLEDLFYIIRENGIPADCFNELFDLVLRVSDFLKDEIAKIQQNQNLSTGNDQLLSEILSFLDKMTIQNQKKTYYLHIRFSADCQMENIRAFMLLDKLDGQVLITIPDELQTNQDASGLIKENGFYCSISTNQSKRQIEEAILGTLSVQSCDFIDSLPIPGCNSEHISNETKPTSSVKYTPSITVKQNLINVDLKKLDELMDLVGEIVIAESMVTGSPDLVGLDLDHFRKSARQLGKLMNELQDIVMSVRMIPIASTFHKMSRIVRDMSKKLAKEVDFIMIGESTEMDKTIIDGIADSLMHLVRNAMDHGIEHSEERIAANKNPTGKLVLSAQNVGGDIIISMSDDGKGIDPDEILEKAKKKNLLSKPENEMTEREIFNLLTLPGFSTNSVVTEFSGRGVGMDVVRKGVEKVGGTVTIESSKGLGTNVFFKIPLTLAIIESMEIKVGEHIYTIPITNVRESFKASKEQLLCDPDGNEMIMIRGVCYPIIRLHTIFNVVGDFTEIEEGILLLVDSGERQACIFADKLIGKNQVVVKPLPFYLNRYATKGCDIAGCTIMSNGNISLILDIRAILNRY